MKLEGLAHIAIKITHINLLRQESCFGVKGHLRVTIHVEVVNIGQYTGKI
jgi:hypothetical protein